MLYLRALIEGYDGMAGAPDPELRESLRSRPLEDLLAELQSRAPEVCEQIDRRNPVRVRRALEKLSLPLAAPLTLPEFRVAKFGLDWPVESLKDRVTRRIDAMLTNGWHDEVRRIRDSGIPYEAPAMAALGYRPLWNSTHEAQVLEEIRLQTTRYAKRQRTWMRSEPNLAKISAEDGRRTVMHWIRGTHG